MNEYEAIFSNPYNDDVSYGPSRATLEAALKDRPTRSEETHEYLSGVREREVSNWRRVPLSKLTKEKP